MNGPSEHFGQITRTLWIGSHYNDRITSVCKHNFATCFYSYYLTKKKQNDSTDYQEWLLGVGCGWPLCENFDKCGYSLLHFFHICFSSPNYWEGTLRWRKKYIFSNIQSILVKFIDEKLFESKISKYPVKNLGNRAFLTERSLTFFLWGCAGEYRSVYTVPVRSLHPGGRGSPQGGYWHFKELTHFRAPLKVRD